MKKQKFVSHIHRCCLLFCLLLGWQGINAKSIQPPYPLPEFSSAEATDWLGSAPLQVAGLRGQVLLVDFWTFSCWNCYRSFPWLNSLQASLADEDFRVIGIHSPEFDHEHDRDKVAAKMTEFGLHHPVMLDNDFRYWQALRNRYWPAYYLVDKQGRVRHLHVGETHVGDARADAIEAEIRQLLAE